MEAALREDASISDLLQEDPHLLHFLVEFLHHVGILRAVAVPNSDPPRFQPWVVLDINWLLHDVVGALFDSTESAADLRQAVEEGNG